MIITAKNTGRATSRPASAITAWRARPSGARSRRRTMFSIMTTEPSTISPKSIAPRLIRLPEMPARTIPVKANSIDSGMAAATISPPRTLPRNSSSTAMTSRPPSARFRCTVAIVRWTSSLRS